MRWKRVCEGGITMLQVEVSNQLLAALNLLEPGSAPNQ